MEKELDCMGQSPNEACRNESAELKALIYAETQKGTKFDDGKPPMDLLPHYPLVEIAKILGHGAEKYGPHNWRAGIKFSRLTAAAERHMGAFKDGEDLDPDSGLSHVAHAACNLLFLLEHLRNRPDMDDRYKGPNQQVVDGGEITKGNAWRKDLSWPRGIRNNNPGNIRITSDKWKGLSEYQYDPDFFQFQSPEWGIRAMAKILITYQDKYGHKTIRGLISRWAPASENNTGAYYMHIAGAAGINLDQLVDMRQWRYANPIIRAMILHENGVQPYTDDQINHGLAMAGIYKPPVSD